jgi:hypothetical protein
MRSHNSQGACSSLNAQEVTIHIDIGGAAHAVYFHKLARSNPDHIYLVLDPAITHTPRACSSNLRLVKWQSANDPDARSQIPLKEHSVDTAQFSFLIGELRGRSVPADRLHDDSEDAELDLFKDVGFTIVQHPTVIEDDYTTAWITALYQVVDHVGATTTAAPAVPTELVA